MPCFVEKIARPSFWFLAYLVFAAGCNPTEQVDGDTWQVTAVRGAAHETGSREDTRDVSDDRVERNACGVEIRTNTAFVEEQDGVWTRHFAPFASDCAQFQLSVSFDQTGAHPQFHYEYSVCNTCDAALKLETGGIHHQEDQEIRPLREDEMIAALVIRDSEGRQFAAPCDAIRRHTLSDNSLERHLTLIQRALIEPREELRTRKSLFFGEFYLPDTEGRQKSGTYRPLDIFDPALKAYIIWAPVTSNSPDVERRTVFDLTAVCDDVVGFDVPFHFPSDLPSFPTQNVGQIELPEAYLQYLR
jgi:hypothetical protein